MEWFLYIKLVKIGPAIDRINYSRHCFSCVSFSLERWVICWTNTGKLIATSPRQHLQVLSPLPKWGWTVYQYLTQKMVKDKSILSQCYQTRWYYYTCCPKVAGLAFIFVAAGPQGYQCSTFAFRAGSEMTSFVRSERTWDLMRSGCWYQLSNWQSEVSERVWSEDRLAASRVTI